MFLPLQCQSVNKRAMLADKTLKGFCSHYQSVDASAEVLFFEYDGVQSKTRVACDLVVYTQAGDVYLHDFQLLKDGNWRNAFGLVAASLEALLPEIALTAKLRKREVIKEFSVKGEDV